MTIYQNVLHNLRGEGDKFDNSSFFLFFFFSCLLSIYLFIAGAIHRLAEVLSSHASPTSTSHQTDRFFFFRRNKHVIQTVCDIYSISCVCICDDDDDRTTTESTDRYASAIWKMIRAPSDHLFVQQTTSTIAVSIFDTHTHFVIITIRNIIVLYYLLLLI